MKRLRKLIERERDRENNRQLSRIMNISNKTSKRNETHQQIKEDVEIFNEERKINEEFIFTCDDG
jgi:hypothetical protein